MSNYNYIKNQDHQVYATMLETINYYKIFPFKNIGYNIYFTNKFQNNVLKDLNKLLEMSENQDKFNQDKQKKYLSLEDLFKIIFNFKKVINGLVNSN